MTEFEPNVHIAAGKDERQESFSGKTVGTFFVGSY